MKKQLFLYGLALFIVTCFAVNVFAADFYVISAPKEVMPTNYAPVEKTGQTTFYRTGDDGDLEEGVAWPNPRFTDNSNGTIKDNLTGLIWLKQANYNSISGETGTAAWNDAIDFCNILETGYCNLSDGSSAGDWRLPSVKELQSLIDFGNSSPALPTGHPFVNVQSDIYRSSTTLEWNPTSAWYVWMDDGYVYWIDKSNSYYVWPVRSDN